MSTARLRADIQRLRERVKPTPPARSDREPFNTWQLRAKIERDQKTPRSVKVARSKIAWLQRVGKLSDFATADALIEDILSGFDGSGGRQPPEERSRILVKRETFAAIRRQDEGMERFEVPPEWAQAFDAADEFREKLLAVPVPVLARWIVDMRPVHEMDASEASAEIEAVSTRHLGPYDLSEELAERVASPDLGLLSPEERHWIFHAPLAGDYCSEWAFQVQAAVRQIDEEGGNE